MLLSNIKARHPLTGELLPVLVSPNVNFGDFLDAIVGKVTRGVAEPKKNTDFPWITPYKILN